jgi:hypothetical protein
MGLLEADGAVIARGDVTNGSAAGLAAFASAGGVWSFVAEATEVVGSSIG